MKYVNGSTFLPEQLLAEVQKYVEGVYIYIPKKGANRRAWGENTNHHREMELRNLQIFDQYLEGASYETLVNRFHLSDKSIRRIVLAEKKRLEPKGEHMKEIIKNWTIEGAMEENITQIYHSAWSVGDDYVLKEYTKPANLHRNIQMFQILGKEGVPVPQVVSLGNGADYYEENGKFYLLTTKLKGRNVVEEKNLDEEWFWKFGSVLAKLHLAFRQCEKTMSFWNNSLLEEMEGWVTEELTKTGEEFLAMEQAREAIGQLREVYGDLPKQLIHRDVYLGNFLFVEKEFSGYIDFDLSQSNIRIFDICYFLLGLLLREGANTVEEEFWFQAVRLVVDGYESLILLSEVERASIPCVMKNIELLFVAYFSREKDEVSAQEAARLFLFICKNENKIQL